MLITNDQKLTDRATLAGVAVTTIGDVLAEIANFPNNGELSGSDDRDRVRNSSLKGWPITTVYVSTS